MFANLTQARLVVALCLFGVCLSLPVRADDSSSVLSALSVNSVQRDTSGGVVIGTTGSAQVRISFRRADLVRVQVSPTGGFSSIPSFDVLQRHWSSVPVTVNDTAAVVCVSSPDITVRIKKFGIQVAVYGEGGRALLMGNAPGGGVRWNSADGSIGQATALAPDERIYGLGQDNRNGGTLDRRGTICDLVTGQQINSGNVTADDPVPFYLSTGHEGHGYGVFVDNVWHMRFDLGCTSPNVLDWSAPGGPIDYYVFDGPSFKTIVENYTQLTGRPAMLPLWAFGYWQSRCAYQNFEEMHGIADELRANGIPVDVMVIDYSWPAHFNDFKWGKSWLASGKSPEDSLAELHADSLHIVQSNSGPMIRQDSPNYASGWDMGIFAKDPSGNPVTCGYYGGELLDFSNPLLPNWLWPQLAVLYKQGIDGWWLDLIEPEGDTTNTIFYAGPNASVRNTFPTRVIATYYNFQKSIAPDSRPVMLGRSASAGEQRYGAVLWTGDTNSDWPTFRAQLPESQNSGLSGLPWWTNDSGGFLSGFYKHDQFGANARLYARWIEFSSFVPIARAHKAGPSAPYEYGPVAIAAARKSLTLRYKLLPYIYSCAHETHDTGLPLLQPLVLQYQNDPIAGEAKDEFLFGPNILVAPVVEEDALSRSVYLPQGGWIGLEDGKCYSGGKTITALAPIDTIPLFVKAGSIIPMAPLMLSTGEKPWDPITLDIYPHLSSSFTMFTDDGLTTAFEHGVYTSTKFSCLEQPGKTVKLTITESNKLFTPKTWIARFHVISAPKTVTVDGRSVKSTYDKASGILLVNVSNGGGTSHSVVLTI